MDVRAFWQLVASARSQVPDPADDEAVVARTTTLLATLPRQEIVDAQRTLSGLMADSYRSSLWAAAYVINGGCSDDGFDYFRSWLVLRGHETFGQAVADPDSLANLAAVRAAANRAIVECESALYIPAKAHRAATGDELPDDAYPSESSELVGRYLFLIRSSCRALICATNQVSVDRRIRGKGRASDYYDPAVLQKDPLC
jgi:hypothetical protein